MSDARPMTASLWAALDLVCARADGSAPTYIVSATPHGDAAITEKTAAALAARGLVQLVGHPATAWPSPAGSRANARYWRTHTAPAQD